MTDTQGTCGSYDLTALPNLVSLPLSKPKKSVPDSLNNVSENEGRELCYHELASDSINEETWDFNENFHDADKQQLSRHVKQTVEYIDLFLPTTILQTYQPVLTALHASENHPHVLQFARQLDYHLRTKFFTGKWSNNSLLEAINQLKVDRQVCYYWKKLLEKILLPESQIMMSSKVLSAFVRKFTKRRCVTYLARDGLAPNHEEDESAVRQMLKKFKEKPNENIKATAKPTDTCFRCHKQGHWASHCPKEHEPEWLSKQKCYLCGKQGHLKVACPNKGSRKTDDSLKTKVKQNIPPTVKPTWYQNGTSLVKLLGNLSTKNLDDFKCYKSISSEM